MEAAGVEGEEFLTLAQPEPEISQADAASDAAGCYGVADPRNDSLHGLAPADPVAAALDRARAAWRARRGSRRLRRDLLRLLAELED